MPQAGHLEVGIVVRELAVTVPFYDGGLGLTQIADHVTPYGRLLKFSTGGDAVIKLMELDVEIAVANPPGGLLGPATGMRWMSLVVPDIEAVNERCQAAGGRVVQPLHELFAGKLLMILEDPERNCWIEVSSVDT